MLDRLNRHDLSDEEWERLRGFLQADPPRGGRWADHRTVINGVFFRARAGCPWRDLPEGFGNWKTIYNRHRRWCPGAWQSDGPRADWTPPYYHRADALGVGFDRSTGGSNAVSQYAPPLAAMFDDPRRTPEKYLLWFHHLPWDYRMASGSTLWDELVTHYTRGWQTVKQMRAHWSQLGAFVDAERYEDVAEFLAIQEREARWWRDAMLAYFQSISRRPFPPGTPPPEHTLAQYEALSFPYAPGNPGWTAAPFADEPH